MFQTLRDLVGGGQHREFFECRHCGANVEGPGERCPECGGGEIAEFLL